MLTTPDMIAPADEAELAAFVADSHAAGRGLWLSGGGTRLPVGQGVNLSLRNISGIVDYAPGELTLIARAGTPLDLMEETLAAEGQALAFEPMDHRVLRGSNGVPTVGGMVAANVSGPRRLLSGACRDHLLGVRFVDGRGRILKNGGRVMKNVTGMDLVKLLAGSHGTLAALTEVVLKTLPVAESQQTLAFAGVTPAQAVEIFSMALATPFEVSGAAFHEGSAWLRIEGLAAQVDYRRNRLTALLPGQIDIIADADSRALWRDLRDLRHFADRDTPLWRITPKPTDAPALIEALRALGGEASMDWGGGLVWYSGPGDADTLRRIPGAGQAVLVRGDAGPIFPAPSDGVAHLGAALRRTFDPAGIFNQGLMG